jgi:hypothetical protein
MGWLHEYAGKGLELFNTARQYGLMDALGIVFFIATCVLSWILFKRSKKTKEPRYAMRSVNIVEKAKSQFPALRIHFVGKSEDIDTCTITHFAFWNAGSETICKQDLTTDALRIEPKGSVEILGANIIYKSADANGFDYCVTKNNTVTILAPIIDSPALPTPR